MKIRLARQGDLIEVAGVYCESFNDVTEESWTIERSTKLFEYWLKRQPDLFYIAEDDSNIVGGIVASAKPWFDGTRLQDAEIFVKPGYQKKGVAKKLLIQLIEEGIRVYNASTFEAITFSNTTFPFSWYEKLGYKKSSELVVITGLCREILNNLKNN